MASKMEIIVATTGEIQPWTVKFETLKDLKDDISSIVLLWDTNSYLVDVKNNLFLVNGGRRLTFPKMGDCRLIYRKRVTQEVSVSGTGRAERKVSWLFGLESIDSGDTLLLKISEFGTDWEWINSL